MKFQARRHSPGERDNAGFTLVELMVAVVIEALIMGALSAAFVGVLRGSGQVTQSLSRSGDARIAANYIVSDARNSSGPEISLTDTTSCPDSFPPVAGTATPVVRFNWNSTGSSASSSANIVNYVLVSNSLLRRQCVGGTLVSDRAVASSVQSVTSVCAPIANCSGTPKSITVTIFETADTSGSTYQYSLTGTFRTLIDTGAPTVPTALMALGGGACSGGVATGVNIASTATLRVYGNAKIDTPDLSTCKSMSLGTTANNYKAGGTQILSGGTCAATAPSTCPSFTSYASALGDPSAGLTVPTASGSPLSGCSGPGLYTATLTLSSNCVMASGVYVLQNGLSITGGTITSAAGGVFLYLSGGTFAESGGATVNLTSMSTGNYAGVLMWRTGSTATTIANTGSVTLNGTLYSPSAPVQFSGSVVATNVTSIVSRSIALSSTATVSLGTASPLSITSPASPLPGWTVNRPLYPNTPLTVSGGDGVSFGFSATNLPAGMAINATSGVISGKPTAAGTVPNVVVTVTDPSGDNVGTATYSLTINAAPAITTATLANGEQTIGYNQTLAKTGGTAPFTWAVTSGMPTGLSINSSTGAITGTPTGTPGASTLAVTLTDAAGATVSQNVSLTILVAPTIATPSLPNGVNGVAYTKTLAGSGGTSSYTWTATPLPAGLSIVAATGVISGTPTGSGSTTVAITLTDTGGATANTSLTLVIQPAIKSVTLTNKASGGTVGKMEVGDKITIVYSATMKVSSFCSTWLAGDASNPTLTGNGLLVNVANSATDVLTVTNSSGCTFNFGTGIDLGSSAYVTAATTFGGASGNTSIAWTAATKTLVITLGAMSGTVGTVAAATTGSYTASGSIQDTFGAVLGNSPFTLPSAVKF